MPGYSDQIIFILEIIGTIAFAASGAMLAIKKKMDLFGICVLAVVTSVGGGFTRDLILGINPPLLFTEPIYTGVAVLVALAFFALASDKRNILHGRWTFTLDRVLAVLDAVGLAIFTSVGITTALTEGYRSSFLLVFVGVITGVGGGLIRDVMAQQMPYILVRHVYALASMLGAFVYVYGYKLIGQLAAFITCSIIIFTVRLLAARYRWNLPKIKNTY